MRVTSVLIQFGKLAWVAAGYGKDQTDCQKNSQIQDRKMSTAVLQNIHDYRLHADPSLAQNVTADCRLDSSTRRLPVGRVKMKSRERVEE
jgi:hypothetical protein